MSIFKKNRLFLIITLVASVGTASQYNGLFRVLNPEGVCRVKRPGQNEFESALSGKAYPYGTTVSCGEFSSATLAFTDNDMVQLKGDTSVTPDFLSSGKCDNKVIRLERGSMRTRFDPARTNDLFRIDTTLGNCVSVRGIGIFSFSESGNDATLNLRADKNSSLRFVGPQFIVPAIENGNAVQIHTKKDSSFTRIRNINGEYPVLMNSLAEFNPPVGADGTNGVYPVTLTQGGIVKIWRESAPIGGRVVVSALATTPAGRGAQHFSFLVGKSSIFAYENLELANIASTNSPVAESAQSGNFDEQADLFGTMETKGTSNGGDGETFQTDTNDAEKDNEGEDEFENLLL